MHSRISILTVALCMTCAFVGCGDDSGSMGSDTGTGGGRDTGTGGGGGGSEPGALRGITAAHNAVRAATGDGVAPLTWDEGLAATAQAWADGLARDGCGGGHSDNDYGENIAGFGGTNGTAQRVVDLWVSERDCYTYGTFMGTDECVGCERSGGCGHYTQVVWENSRRLGCGMATCENAAVWVCNYDPPGNVLRQAPY